MTPDLTHAWHQPDPANDPTYWECPACLSATRGAPSSTLCPAKVSWEMASSRIQVDQAIRNERARVVHYIYSRAQEIGAAGGSVDPDGDFVYRFVAEALEDIASEVESGDHLPGAR